MGLVWGGEGSEGMLRRGRRRSIGTGSYFATSVLYVSIDFCTLSVHRLLLSSLFLTSSQPILTSIMPAT